MIDLCWQQQRKRQMELTGRLTSTLLMFLIIIPRYGILSLSDNDHFVTLIVKVTLLFEAYFPLRLPEMRI